ncbi:MAG: hypothetical protein AB7R40_13365 [Nitrospiraceae bacterium]
MPIQLCRIAIAAVLGIWSLSQWPLTTFHAMADLLEDKRVIIQAKHADAVRTFLQLDPREEATFWPVYEEYRADSARTNDRFAQLIRSYAGNSDHLSDQQAEQLLTDFLQWKEETVQLHYQYIGRFRQILPGRKIVRLFQLQQKLNAAIEADLANVVPLVK